MVKHDAGGKKGQLLCCKHIFNQIKANFAKIQLKKHQDVQKCIFCKKFQESMGWPLDSCIKLSTTHPRFPGVFSNISEQAKAQK